MNCKYFKPSQKKTCTEGHYQGSPSVLDCLECPHYDGPSRGAGDVIARVIETLRKVSIKENQDDKVIHKNTCSGCAKRRAKLNKLFPKKDR